MGASPGAVEAWPSTWGCGQGPRGPSKDRGGTARDRGDVAKAVGPWERGQDRGGEPCRRGQGRGGAARGRWGTAKAVRVR